MAKKKVDTTPKTKKPSGLSISRDGMKFACTWKIGDTDYGAGQTFKCRLNNRGKWVAVNVGARTKSKTINLNNPPRGLSVPAKITAFSFAVKGTRKSYKKKINKDDKKETTFKPTVSDTVKKTYEIKTPDKPGASASLTGTRTTKFTWTIDTSSTSAKWCTGYYWESMRVKNSSETDGSKLTWKNNNNDWRTGSGASSSETSIDEPATLLADGASYARWFRIRANGKNGNNSPWTYASHVYAKPNQAVVDTKQTKAVSVSGADATEITVVWQLDANRQRPADSVKLEYVISVPDANLALPAGASWQELTTVKDTGSGKKDKGLDKVVNRIDGKVGLDEILYVRVNALHDYEENTNYGKTVIAQKGSLKPPRNLSIDDIVPATYRVTLSVTNDSDVPDSRLAVYFKTSTNPKGDIIGIIPHGVSQITVQCPVWTNLNDVTFAVRAFQGSSSYKTISGVTYYTINPNMQSTEISVEGNIPIAPRTVTLSATNIVGTINVAWDWAWATANRAELSWADHEDAWESTDDPSTYTVSSINASRWNISGLATGVEWFVRVRLVYVAGEVETYSPYSDIVSISLASAPAIPSLTLSSSVIVVGGTVTASWGYSSTDGTAQAYAEVTDVIIDTNGTHYGRYALTTDTEVVSGKEYFVFDGTNYSPVTPEGDEDPSALDWYDIQDSILGHTTTAQFITLDSGLLDWQAGEIHNLAVRVRSGSGQLSDDWSTPVSVHVAEPLEINITQDSLYQNLVITDDDGDTRTVPYSLRIMPFTITVTGAGAGGTTIVSIERARDYHVDRPDESEFNGYEGETIAIATQTGEAQITITQDDLIGHLDDEAFYRVVATIKDELGQSAETSKEFEVHWERQAIIPNAQLIIDNDALIAKLTPLAPAGVGVGDVCDIYRLSVDRPQLIYQDAEWGTMYVDPYPTIGSFGGYRFVYRTINGDYITEDNHFAWVDLFDTIENTDYNVIDFGDGQVILTRNIDLSNKWEKDFQETAYLGGSIQGDWNPAVSRSSEVGAVALTLTDGETIEAMRRLATYAGICHVRTKDGSSYAADVQVSEEYSHKTGSMVASFTLNITRVDPEELDGMTYEEWLASQARGQI